MDSAIRQLCPQAIQLREPTNRQRASLKHSGSCLRSMPLDHRHRTCLDSFEELATTKAQRPLPFRAKYRGEQTVAWR